MNVHKYVRGLLIIGTAAGLVQSLAHGEDGPTAAPAPAFGSAAWSYPRPHRATIGDGECRDQ